VKSSLELYSQGPLTDSRKRDRP